MAENRAHAGRREAINTSGPPLLLCGDQAPELLSLNAERKPDLRMGRSRNGSHSKHMSDPQISPTRQRFYAPLTATILQPFAADANLPMENISTLDKLYMSVMKALDQLADQVGLRVAV